MRQRVIGEPLNLIQSIKAKRAEIGRITGINAVSGTTRGTRYLRVPTIRPEQSPRRPLSLSRIRATAAACTTRGQKGGGRQDSRTNVTDVQSVINQALVHAASCGVTMNLM